MSYLMWFVVLDSDLWKELKEEVGCTYLVKMIIEKAKSIKN